MSRRRVGLRSAECDEAVLGKFAKKVAQGVVADVSGVVAAKFGETGFVGVENQVERVGGRGGKREFSIQREERERGLAGLVDDFRFVTQQGADGEVVAGRKGIAGGLRGK